MREIKFRAFNKTNNIMEDVINLEWRENYATGKTEIDIITRYAKVSDELILMQYTGLKDKNGKEIYEGDICVRYLDGKKVCTDGKTWKDYWLIEWLNKTAGFTTTKIADYSVHFKKMMTVDKKQNSFSTRFNEVEVIGNIYENPELLEEPK